MIPHAIFFALRGLRFDGHTFAQQALERGASCVVIDDTRYQADSRYVLVDNVLETLQGLAMYHRKQLKIPMLGITGSSGKTTTKELMQAILCRRYMTTATKGNLNNHIGVPLTVLAMDDKTEVGIVEMGANHVGEIARLCEIAMPTHGLVTNIGHVHIEGFGGFEGVIKGKSELYDYLFRRDGVVFLNTMDSVLGGVTKQLTQVITYPQQRDFYHCRLVREGPFVVYQSENAQIVTSHLSGHYHFYNIAAALCVAKYFGVDETDANEAIRNYRPSNNRSQVIKKGSNTIFLDAYNANLESIRGAIHAFHLMPATHRILIIGDMAELGEETEEAHQAVGRLTTQAVYKSVLLCGPHMKAAKESNPSALYFFAKESLVAYLKQQKFEDTNFLIKGSRFLQLETLVEFIY
ncbi:MAG: UDP-N-acetylmuramoyl-tripeptide--D-alanyl-D-alanine ligase [Amoebophilaceae bacterium]|jgi:UDP-N-acetylmuramoyl-tripeptide--D-alanyl-D-alanine ligase|nr:UDP-N-acetylmuramoyl-tripeptide--D-alanyl-D-alanine ligase [Amoebophilaceae bacterium]